VSAPDFLNFFMPCEQILISIFLLLMKTFKNLNTVPKRNPIQEAGSANGSETFPKAANDSENVPEDAHTYFLADFSA
jgi:hypothetical protein